MTELLRRHETLVVAFVSNSLRHGPAHVPTLIAEAKGKGITAPQLSKAYYHLACTRRKVDGETYWMRPANLYAIWWGNRPAHHYERQKRRGGSAA
jgi:hypothetical protein